MSVAAVLCGCSPGRRTAARTYRCGGCAVAVIGRTENVVIMSSESIGGIILERKDWALLAIAAAAGEPVSPVQLQKSLFLLGKNFAADLGVGFYRFDPYDYGPFASEVYRDAESLGGEGFIAIDTAEPSRSWKMYAATPAGLERATQLEMVAPDGTAAYVKAVVAWARSLSFRQLVSAIYAQYPEQRANSVFRG